jgi:hypothetical protein
MTSVVCHRTPIAVSAEVFTAETTQAAQRCTADDENTANMNKLTRSVLRGLLEDWIDNAMLCEAIHLYKCIGVAVDECPLSLMYSCFHHTSVT